MICFFSRPELLQVLKNESVLGQVVFSLSEPSIKNFHCKFNILLNGQIRAQIGQQLKQLITLVMILCQKKFKASFCPNNNPCGTTACVDIYTAGPAGIWPAGSEHYQDTMIIRAEKHKYIGCRAITINKIL